MEDVEGRELVGRKGLCRQGLIFDRCWSRSGVPERKERSEEIWKVGKVR